MGVRHAKRCSDTGILSKRCSDTGILLEFSHAKRCSDTGILDTGILRLNAQVEIWGPTRADDTRVERNETEGFRD